MQDLPHLERRLEAAGNAVTCLALYSRSCGACKDMLRFQRQLCRESSGQLAGAVFLKHNIRHAAAAAAAYMHVKVRPSRLLSVVASQRRLGLSDRHCALPEGQEYYLHFLPGWRPGGPWLLPNLIEHEPSS